MTMGIEVIELSEDSNSWMVTGLMEPKGKRDEAGRVAIDAWLVQTIGHDAEALAEARANLRATTSTPGTWWLATGHREGELVSQHECLAPEHFYGLLFR